MINTQGPYLIIDKIGNHNVRLAVEEKLTKIIQKDKLKKANILAKNEFASQSLTKDVLSS